jgi:hypothetical protein
MYDLSLIPVVLFTVGWPLLPLLLLPIFLLRLPTGRSWTKFVAGLAVLTSLGAFLLVAFLIDVYFVLAPHSLIFCAVVIATAIAVNFPLLRRFPSKAGATFLAAFCVAMIVLNFAHSDIKAFKQFYSQIQNGMTEQEVAAAMQKEFSARPITVHDVRSGRDAYLFSMVTNQSFYNAFVFLDFKEGQVVGKAYQGD